MLCAPDRSHLGVEDPELAPDRIVCVGLGGTAPGGERRLDGAPDEVVQPHAPLSSGRLHPGWGGWGPCRGRSLEVIAASSWRWFSSRSA